MSFPGDNFGPQQPYLTRHLDTVGNGTGSFNMGVDGSVTPVVFKIAPGAGEVFHISRIIIYVQDSGSFDAVKWGNNITMTNGLSFGYVQNSVTISLVNGTPIKTSGEMAAFSFDIAHHAFGQGDEILVGRWSINKSGYTIRLIGDDGDSLFMTVNDDLTGLSEQNIIVQGFTEGTEY